MWFGVTLLVIAAGLLAFIVGNCLMEAHNLNKENLSNDPR